MVRLNGKPRWPHYGIDLFVFKLSKEKAEHFQKIIQSWHQYDWGINDNFYVAASEALNLSIHNMYKNSSVIKHENNFSDFEEGGDLDEFRRGMKIKNIFEIFCNLTISA